MCLNKFNLFIVKGNIFFIVFCFSLYLMIALVDYEVSDPNLFQLTFPNNVCNITGKIGAILADLFFFIFGKIAYCIPCIIMFFFWRIILFFKDFNFFILSCRLLGIFVVLLSSCGFVSLCINNINNYETGGVVGSIVSDIIVFWCGYCFSYFILLLVWLFGIMLCIDVSWINTIERIIGLIIKNLTKIYTKNYYVKINNDYCYFFMGKKQLISFYCKKNKIKLKSGFFFIFKNKKDFKLRYVFNDISYNNIQINNYSNLYKQFIYLTINYDDNFYISYNILCIKASFSIILSALYMSYTRNLFYQKKYLINVYYHLLEKKIYDWGVTSYQIKKFYYSVLIVMHDANYNKQNYSATLLNDCFNNIHQYNCYNKKNINSGTKELYLNYPTNINEDVSNLFRNRFFRSLNNSFLSKNYLNSQKQKIFISNLHKTAKLIESKLLDYNIKANVINILPGPVITRFELNLSPGVKSSRLVNISRDLARSLSVSSLRIIEVIPGKPYVGLEISNNERQLVDLHELLICDEFCYFKSLLTLVLGKDIEGKPFVSDLAKMPHLLIAGTTGSGKSMIINAMILSILCKATPKKVRLILVDPKMLELSIYQGIPHLLTEVITDMRNVYNILLWCIEEMNYRYKLMSIIGVRGLETYNKYITESYLHGNFITNPLYNTSDNCLQSSKTTLDVLPYIVIIIDEFADLMIVSGKKIEKLIIQLSQKARAAGIHLILATQRPSVNIITGVIKANIPARISFVVASKVDSRTVLDQNGAEELLGMGDMLFLSPNSPNLVRIHGAYIQEKLINLIIKNCKHCNTTQ